jgi:hypothetical protein
MAIYSLLKHGCCTQWNFIIRDCLIFTSVEITSTIVDLRGKQNIDKCVAKNAVVVADAVVVQTFSLTPLMFHTSLVPRGAFGIAIFSLQIRC